MTAPKQDDQDLADKKPLRVAAQPALGGCGAAGWELAGVDHICTLRASSRQPAMVGCAETPFREGRHPRGMGYWWVPFGGLVP